MGNRTPNHVLVDVAYHLERMLPNLVWIAESHPGFGVRSAARIALKGATLLIANANAAAFNSKGSPS